MYVIVPESCEFPPPGTQFENEEHIGPLEPIVMGTRKYFLQLYVLTITSPGKWKGKVLFSISAFSLSIIRIIVLKVFLGFRNVFAIWNSAEI